MKFGKVVEWSWKSWLFGIQFTGHNHNDGFDIEAPGYLLICMGPLNLTINWYRKGKYGDGSF